MLGHVVALGGGGFSSGEDDPFDDFVLALTGKPRPRICFLPTASGDSDRHVVSFYEAFGRRACEPTHLPLFARGRDPSDVLLAQDIVYVGGGNVANMLVIWRLHGVDRALREAWRRGTVLAGVSAGANCWFEDSTTDSYGELRRTSDGLSFLEGSFCPHYDSEPGRRPLYLQLVAEGLPAGYAAEDGAAVHFDGERLLGAVTCREGACAYRVEKRDGEVVETPLSMRRL